MLIIFDMDGTLINSGDVITNTINFVRKNLNLPEIPKDIMLKNLNNPDINSAEFFYGTSEFTPEQTELFGEYYDENCTKEDVREVLEYALMLRRRIKEQLKKIGGMEFYDVNFSYIDIDLNEEIFVNVPEGNSKSIIQPDLPAGSIYTIATNPQTHKGLITSNSRKR